MLGLTNAVINNLLIETVRNSQKIERRARQSRYDLRHHHQMLLEYAKNGDTQAVIHYLAEYERQEEQKVSPRLRANRTVDPILRSYLRKAEACSITVTTETAMREETSVADVDLVAIPGNVLENAIHGCMASQAPRAWAMENSVSDGTSLTATITCQQFVTMLWRYARDQGFDVSVGEDTNVLSCTDALSISECAVPAMQ